MSTITQEALVIATTPEGSQLEVGSQCSSCASSCGNRARRLTVPQAVSGEVMLAIDSADISAALEHSLARPLLGFVCGTLLVGMVSSQDFWLVLGAILGFTIGVLCCRPVEGHVMQVSKLE